MASNADSGAERRSMVEALEGRMLLSASPLLVGQTTFPTHTVLKVDAGTLGQPVTFEVTVFSKGTLAGAVDLFCRGKMFKEIGLAVIASPDPRLYESEATYTVSAGAIGAEMFGVGPHAVRAFYVGMPYFSGVSSAISEFRVKRPQFVAQPSGIRIATVEAGSGPALQPGQTATVQYNAYVAATYRLFDSTESQTPDTFSFTVDASPKQVIPGLDAGVAGMQASETRAIYIPYQLGYGTHGSRPTVPPRANLVYLVTLMSIG